MGRKADRCGGQDPAGSLKRQIVLTQVQARVEKRRDIRAVVDDEVRARGCAEGFYGFCVRKTVASIDALVAELQDPDASR